MARTSSPARWARCTPGRDRPRCSRDGRSGEPGCRGNAVRMRIGRADEAGKSTAAGVRDSETENRRHSPSGTPSRQLPSSVPACGNREGSECVDPLPRGRRPFSGRLTARINGDARRPPGPAAAGAPGTWSTARRGGRAGGQVAGTGVPASGSARAFAQVAPCVDRHPRPPTSARRASGWVVGPSSGPVGRRAGRAVGRCSTAMGNRVCRDGQSRRVVRNSLSMGHGWGIRARAGVSPRRAFGHCCPGIPAGDSAAGHAFGSVKV